MTMLEEFTNSLLQLLTNKTLLKNSNIVRIHTRKLEENGDLSFPISIKNWYKYLDTIEDFNEIATIFDYMHISDNNLNNQLKDIKEKTREWNINIEKIVVLNNDVHLFLNRPILLKFLSKEVLESKNKFGRNVLFNDNINIQSSKPLNLECDLTALRFNILSEVSQNLANFCTYTPKSEENIVFHVGFSNNKENNHRNIICGPIINEDGVKDVKTTAIQLLNKRAVDLRLIAQHKYGIPMRKSTEVNDYFNKLGRASIYIEMLSNKPHKSCKITLNNLNSCNKGAAFIFYNCARLETLLRQFDDKVLLKLYPELPNIAEVNFELLNQPEEWELFYVYVCQFPLTIKNSIQDLTKGIVNPQNLTTFLSNFSSLFSTYYRRVKILTEPKDHLFPTLHARIYLLKCLQQVFHNALALLNIEPIKEM